ncbi:MAG: hypothetical protein LBN95_00175, partial [Prevotellaceae bacterium]|nr:hypothetical protein [Prevotellaceae bacterium]
MKELFLQFFGKKQTTPFGYSKKINARPKSAQDTIPFLECYDNGLFLAAPDTYTLVFAFENLDYALYRDSEQEEVHKNYIKMLNALPLDVTYQEFLMNSKTNTDKLQRTLIPENCNSDRFNDTIFAEYKRMNADHISRSDIAASEKILVASLCYKPQGT